MDPYSIATAILILLVALAFSPLGLGGGVLYVPILHYIAGWSIIEAILGSLTLVMAVAIGSGLAHTQEGHAKVEVARAGKLSAVPFAIVGTGLAWLSIEYVSDMVIKVLAAIIMLLIIVLTIKRSLGNGKDVSGSMENLGRYKKWAAFGGISSGFLGIGGGTIYVTLHRTVVGLDTRTSAGTSYLIEVAVVPVALVSHILLDQSLPDVYANIGLLAAIFVPLAVFGVAWTSARFAIKHLPTKVLTTAFLIAVSISLCRYLWDIVGF